MAGGTDGKGPDDRLLISGRARLDQKSMEGLLEEVRPGMVIDATHPYAVEVSENIRRACTAFPHILFIRCLRRESGAWDNPVVIRVPDVRAAVQWLAGQEGNILVTTGVKELSASAAFLITVRGYTPGCCRPWNPWTCAGRWDMKDVISLPCRALFQWK